MNTILFVTFITLLFSHLTVDKDFPEKSKNIAFGILGVIAVAYVLIVIF